MTEDIQLKQLVQSLSSGVAVVDIDSWRMVMENSRFFQWFPPAGDGEEPLETQVPGINVERARSRLEGNRPFRFETEAKAGARTVPLSIELKPLENGESTSLAVVECRDISK